MKRLLAAILLWSSACYGAIVVNSSPDPFLLPTISTNNCCGQQTTGKTLASQAIDTSIRNLILIPIGQSLSGPNSGATYTPSNPSKLDNFSYLNGAIYTAVDPLAGSGNDTASLGPGSYSLRIADTLITNNKFDRVIIAPISVGGTNVASWATGNNSTRTTVLYNRLVAKGITVGMTNVTMAFIWGQGEQDNADGTSQASYTASLNTVISTIRSVGFNTTVPIFVNIESSIGGVAASNVTNAQAAVVNHSNGVWAGGNIDSIGGGERSDGTHLNATGAASAASLLVTAMGLYGPPF